MSELPPDEDGLLRFVAVTVEEMRDRMATRADVAALQTDIAAVRGDIEQVHLRLDSIEKAITARMGELEAEVSRLRSALYLLAKGQPEVLRLLGK